MLDPWASAHRAPLGKGTQGEHVAGASSSQASPQMFLCHPRTPAQGLTVTHTYKHTNGTAVLVVYISTQNKTPGASFLPVQSLYSSCSVLGWGVSPLTTQTSLHLLYRKEKLSLPPTPCLYKMPLLPSHRPSTRSPNPTQPPPTQHPG